MTSTQSRTLNSRGKPGKVLEPFWLAVCCFDCAAKPTITWAKVLVAGLLLSMPGQPPPNAAMSWQETPFSTGPQPASSIFLAGLESDLLFATVERWRWLRELETTFAST